MPGQAKMKTTTDDDIPQIKSGMTGRNHGRISHWYSPEELGDLLLMADVGDLLEISRGPFCHWAIYAGLDSVSEQPYVVHFGADMSSEGHSKNSVATVNRNNLRDVVGESGVRINNGLSIEANPVKDVEVLNRRISDFVTENKSYNIINFNCENFVNYCRYGVGKSTQSVSVFCILSGVLTCSAVSQAPATVLELTALASAVGLTVAASVVGLRQKACSTPRPTTSPYMIGLLASIFVVAAALASSLIGLGPTASLFVGSLKHVTLLIQLVYFYYVVEQRAAVCVTLVSYLVSLLMPVVGVSAFGVPLVVYMIGMSYVASVGGPISVVGELKLPAAVYVIGLSCLAAFLRPTYVYMALLLPLVVYVYGFVYMVFAFVVTIVVLAGILTIF